MERSWTPVLKSLADYFLSQERDLDLISEIDKKVIRGDTTIDDFIEFVTKGLRVNSYAQDACFYVLSSNGSEEVFLLCSGASESLVHEIPGEHCQRLKAQIGSSTPEIKAAADWAFLPWASHVEGDIAAMSIPVWIRGSLFGVVFLLSPLPLSHSHFSEATVLQHCEMVGRQLEIALGSLMEGRQSRLRDTFIRTVLEESLKPSACLQLLLAEISTFLPTYGPLKLAPLPRVQILYYSKPDEYLTIKATQGQEPFNTRVFIASSVCGMLIDGLVSGKQTDPFLLVDPHEHPQRFQWFLGAENGADAPHSELAVAVISRDAPIAVINLEHPAKNAFRREHVNGILYAAQSLGPLLRALQDRTERQRARDASLLYALQCQLNRLASQFQHRMATPLQKCHLSIEDVAELLAADQRAERPLTVLRNAVDSLEASSQEFQKSLPDFIVYGKYNLRRLLEGVVNQFGPSKLHDTEKIEVSIECAEDIYVFCSAFVAEHFYNIINNALYSVRQAIAEGLRTEGHIRVVASIEDVTARRIRTDETSRPETTNCFILVRDDGKGAEEEDKPYIGTPGFTTKRHGSGYGLSAASEYAQSIGGDLAWSSVPKSFFEVKMRLGVFDERVHGQLGSRKSHVRRHS
jgi:signal transduction histidine kinase